MTEAALELQDLSMIYRGRRHLFEPRPAPVRAVDNVSLEVRRGETLGIVGESGSGKSTIARLAAGLAPPTAGTIRVGGRDLSELKGRDRRDLHRRVQLVFQDAAGSLNPRRTVRRIVGAPLRVLLRLPRIERERRLESLMDQAGLDPALLERYPHELSGGQAQRVVIARALAAEPEILLLDEPTSSLDVTVQAQVLRLLHALKRSLGLTYLFISHDLAVVEAVCDRVAVMRRGRVVELAPREALFGTPRHRYTRLLLASVPTLGGPRRGHQPASGA